MSNENQKNKGTPPSTGDQNGPSEADRREQQRRHEQGNKPQDDRERTREQQGGAGHGARRGDQG